jgi:hypothetical protein
LGTSASKKENNFLFKLKNIFAAAPVRYAFAALLLISVGVLVYLNYFTPRPDIIYMTQNSEQKNIELPDGSQAHLNSASELKVMPFGGRRVVYLKGQALFEVRKNKGDFIVQTDYADIKVTGTKFDVRAHDKKTRVSKQSLNNKLIYYIHYSTFKSIYVNLSFLASPYLTPQMFMEDTVVAAMQSQLLKRQASLNHLR